MNDRDEDEDRYPNWITRKDLDAWSRGWAGFDSEKTLVSRSDSIITPSEEATIMGTPSTTLSRESLGNTNQLEDNVALQVVLSSALQGVLKYAANFMDPIPLTLQRTCIEIVFMKNSQRIIISAIVPYTDVQGILGKEFKPGVTYAIKKSQPSEVTKMSKALIKFRSDGTIERTFKALQTLISTSPTECGSNEAMSKIGQIQAQK